MIPRLAILALVSAAFAAEVTATEKTDGQMTGPISNHWDANAWEPGGGPVFWRAGAEKSASAATRKPADPNQSTPGLAPAPKKIPAKTDFSNRQSEK